jgi:hypothetical protein
MRRSLILGVVSLLAFGGTVSTPAISTCSIVGTPGRDIVAGTSAHDLICVLGGGDYVHADGKGDRVFGAGGADTLIGGGGRDRLVGGAGSDKLFSIDQRHGNDVVKGGYGNDQCYIDRGDRALGCEHVYVGNRPSTTQALSTSFLGVSELGEAAQDQTKDVPACPPPADGIPPCP